MFGSKSRKIKAQQRTINCLKKVIESLEEDLASAKAENYKLQVKRVGRPKKQRRQNK